MKPDEGLPLDWFRIVRERVDWFVIDDLSAHLKDSAVSQNDKRVAEALAEGSELDATPPKSP
ncbi:MAG: hypothetical protein AB1714_05680 [Acidobacteriota bacterium]